MIFISWKCVSIKQFFVPFGLVWFDSLGFFLLFFLGRGEFQSGNSYEKIWLGEIMFFSVHGFFSVNKRHYRSTAVQTLHGFWVNAFPQRCLAGMSLLHGIPGNFESLPFIPSDTNDNLRCRWEEVVKNNCILHDCLGKVVTSKLKGVAFPICSEQVTQHLECCIQFWTPQYKTDMDIF